MARERIVYAEWDNQAGVWVATSDDVPGLVTESKTFEALLKKLRTLVPELLELNGAMPKSGKASYKVVANRHEITQAAE
jgi:predicted RNase H-like HicB family nuclease